MFFHCIYMHIASLHWYMLVNAKAHNGAVNLGIQLQSLQG